MVLIDNQWQRNYQNPIGRWAGVGPYYAMFPNEFAFDVVHRFTNPGDRVLDPFAGRFSSIYASTTQGRDGTGIEINPVGWVYGQAKLHPAAQDDVKARLKEICRRSRWFGIRSQRKLPEFFSYCYSEKVLAFLLAAKSELNWRNDRVDTTLMSLILVALHAKLGSGLSNQMRQSKAMAPDYSVKWWQDNGLEIPPTIDPLSFMLKKIDWRYQHGVPTDIGSGEALLADSTVKLADLKLEIENDGKAKFKLLLTSPPYYDITHYHYDQWLRLWMLGNPPWPSKTEDKHRGRFSGSLAKWLSYNMGQGHLGHLIGQRS
ncbi:MAG: site-specific DNA-methyltransferase [Ardenticatenaceae bacterium]|nr:site-specific DNA-methyltransferase [Ardenticatenaceae bacterium]